MKAEPAVIGAAVAAAINAVVLLLLKHDLDPDARNASVSLVTLIAGVFIRTRVTPVA
jgi:hypothetical protein